MALCGGTVSSDQIRTFLDLPKRARIKDHVTELRKKLAQAGADPNRILEHVGGQTGYRLSPGVHTGMLLPKPTLRSGLRHVCIAAGSRGRRSDVDLVVELHRLMLIV